MTTENNRPKVEYREVDGFPCYRVGSDGSVWSCLKRGRSCRYVVGDRWIQLRGARTQKGYLTFLLRRHDGKLLNVRGHKIVLEAFVGKRPEGKECAHANGIRDDNRVENLRWATHEENYADQICHGTNGKCGRARAKLSVDQVLEIRELSDAGHSRAALSRRFSVSTAVIYKIAVRLGWKHIPEGIKNATADKDHDDRPANDS